MRSVVVPCLLAFAAGAVALQTCAVLPAAPAWVAIAAAGAWSAAVVARARGYVADEMGITLALGAAFAVGFAYAAWRAESRLADTLPEQLEGANVRIVGVVDGLPAVTDQGVRFAFAVERVVHPGAHVPARISLAWFAALPREVPAAIPAVHAGERWEFTVRLKRPHGSLNPGGFDLEAWLLQQGLRATGYVHADADAMLVSAHAGRWRDHVQRARESIRARIAAALPADPYAGVIAALAIGDQRGITDAHWKVFNRTGVGHLVSISGLHVTVFASIVGGLALLLARRSVRLTSRIPARKLAAATGLAAAGAYVLLAGAEIPALRTLAMLAVAACGLWVGRPGTARVVWLWALVAVLLLDPFASLTPGFWLSYGAVALLLYASAARLQDDRATRTWRTRLASHLTASTHAQWVVTLGLAPLTLALFGQMSLVGPLANAVAIPVVTMAVVPLALLGIVLPVDALFVAAHAVLAPLMAALERMASAPAAAWEQHAPPPWTIVAALLGALWLLAPRGVPGRVWGWLWLVPMFVVRPEPPAHGAFRLTVLDVGQGLAVVVTTRAHVLVYDTGPRYTDVADAGGRIVAPFLRYAGIGRADALVVSHQDLDHAGGALSLLQTVPVGWLASSLPFEHPVVDAVAAQAPAWPCVAGQQWTWDGVHFTMLHPTAGEYRDRFGRTNDRSCVVRIDSSYGSALLPGDIEAKSEASLLRTQADSLRADVLVVPHHGSRTSSTPAFVRAVAPSLALVASGPRNRFGHPRADVVARFETLGTQVLRTDQLGALTIRFEDAAGPRWSAARIERGRYWLATPRP